MGPQTLSRIVDAIRQVGYCVVPEVLTPETARGLRSIVDALRARETQDDATELGHQRVLHLAAKHPAFVDLMCHPVALAVWEHLLGADCICSTWTSNTAFPGADLTYWHVDHPYWAIASPYPVEIPLTGQTIWCLDSFSETNGATRFIPGSHLRPYIPEHNGNYDDSGLTVEAPIGSLILAHGACWHSAGYNRSDQPRTAIFGRYAWSFLIPQEEIKLQLSAINDPTPLVERLLGAKQYVPQRGFPY